jgi:hypothetical protein
MISRYYCLCNGAITLLHPSKVLSGRAPGKVRIERFRPESNIFRALSKRTYKGHGAHLPSFAFTLWFLPSMLEALNEHQWVDTLTPV